MPWLAEEAEINDDMIAAADETSEWIRDFYRRSWAHAKKTFAVTDLDDTDGAMVAGGASAPDIADGSVAHDSGDGGATSDTWTSFGRLSTARPADSTVTRASRLMVRSTGLHTSPKSKTPHDEPRV